MKEGDCTQKMKVWILRQRNRAKKGGEKKRSGSFEIGVEQRMMKNERWDFEMGEWSNIGEIENLKTQLGLEFEMTDLGELSYFLGIEFMKTSRGIIMHQRKCITETLKRFHMQNCNSVAVPVEVNLKIDNSESEQNLDATLYRQIVGCLRFICHSRPEISHGVGVISRFTTRPKQSHLATTKRIRRYRKGIENVWDV